MSGSRPVSPLSAPPEPPSYPRVQGIDLVVDVIPAICERYPHVHFVIGGDGPKKLLLEEMRERHQLHDRVELLGAVAHKNVRDVLTRGHIFLNCSLTEAFCIAILEAAWCAERWLGERGGMIAATRPPHLAAVGALSSRPRSAASLRSSQSG